MRKLHILRRQGGILKQFDLRAGSTAYIVYAYNIESPLARWWQLAPVFACDFGHFAPLVPVDRRYSGFHIVGCARLNFNKAKDIAVPPDQVDLAPAARGAKVARYHNVTAAPQVEVSVFFAAPAYMQVSRRHSGGEHTLRNPIQAADERFCDSGGKHGGK
jgi:hypothetical protein